jgi:beta-galactosidase
VFVDGAYQGGFSRPALPAGVSQQLNVVVGGELALGTPTVAGTAELDIFVEGMGRINYGHGLIDRKGILGTVTLNGLVVTPWRTFLLHCPASWLRHGHNEIIIFDHHQTAPKPIAFTSTLD